MKNQEYSIAFTETLYILNHIDVKNRIPKNFLEFLYKNSSKIYKPNFDCSKSIKDLNLNSKTIGILDFILNKFILNKNERFNKVS